MSKLHAPNNTTLSEAIGKNATVYLNIPGKGLGSGQINIVIGGALRNYIAITNDERGITTNSIVEVIGIHNDNTLIVKNSISNQ